LVATLDHDLIGFAGRRPAAVTGVCVGVGPASRLDELPAAFALAGRALQTAVAFGEEGVFALSDLSIRPAVLVDPALGEAFEARLLAPLGELGRGLGDELESTLRAWMESGMRVEETARELHLHPNTLRHRLRRFEEATGCDLRAPADLVELWWALEHRRLGARSGD
jgi:DNA-binding PucR family transcriptional regulator